MGTDIILAGVGGQGILSISYIIDMAALKQGWCFKQAEVHGMSQRGGEVVSHLRLSERPIWSDLVPRGGGDLVLSVEPLESLRYLDYLSPRGTVVTGVDPYVNIPGYPEEESLLEELGRLPQVVLVHAERLARQVGSARAQNMVLLGAASPYLPIARERLEQGIREAFGGKGERMQKINVDAFHAGYAAGQAYRACREAGLPARETRALTGRLRGGALEPGAVALWQQVFRGGAAAEVLAVLTGQDQGQLVGAIAVPRALLDQGASSAEALKRLLLGG